MTMRGINRNPLPFDSSDSQLASAENRTGANNAGSGTAESLRNSLPASRGPFHKLTRRLASKFTKTPSTLETRAIQNLPAGTAGAAGAAGTAGTAGTAGAAGAAGTAGAAAVPRAISFSDCDSADGSVTPRSSSIDSNETFPNSTNGFRRDALTVEALNEVLAQFSQSTRPTISDYGQARSVERAEAGAEAEAGAKAVKP